MYYIKIGNKLINLEQVTHICPIALGGLNHSIAFYMSSVPKSETVSFGNTDDDKKERDGVFITIQNLCKIQPKQIINVEEKEE